MTKTVLRATAAALITVAAIAGPAATHAEEIDLETAVALALESNLGIESELAAVRQKKLIADTWWNRFYPTANATVTMGRSNTESSVTGLAPLASSYDATTGGFDQVTAYSADQPQWFLSAGVDLSLVLTMQMVPGISLARLDYENGLISLAQARAQVERDVSKQFYQLLLIRQQIELQQEQISNAERRYEQAQANYDNGLIDEYTLLSSQVNLENLRPALAGLQVQYQQALLGFRNSLGLPLNQDITPVGEIDPPEIVVSGVEIDENALRERFDIQQLRMANQILVEQRRVTEFSPQGGRAPYVRFGFSVDPAFQGDPMADNWFDLDLWGQRSGALTVSIVQPLDAWLPFSQTRNQISDVETQIRQNDLNMQQALRGAEIGVRGLLLQIRTSQQSLVALEQNVELARRAYELAEVGYNNGLRDLLEVQTAELDLRNAELNLLKEQKNVMDSLLDLEYELNASLDDIREMQ